ncbi:MAG TPA: AsnC family transcriptional regulator [Geminicoccaceae bacterium]|nr:AsnC family transcriptional regulator [Geminicoccaceae bacterium]
MDEIDRRLINALQGGFPITERPYAAAGEELGLGEEEVIARLRRLLEEERVLSRFGPMYDAERLGGGVTLAAMAVPEARFEEVAAIVNGFPEVAHNYARAHALNMWFVVATDDPARIDEVLSEIKAATGLDVLNLPKLEEYFLELKLSA